MAKKTPVLPRDYTPIVFITPSYLDGFTEQVVGTPLTASISFVVGPGTPPGYGTGSVQFATGANGAGGAELRQGQYDLLQLADLTALSYNTYVSSFGSSGHAPYLLLDINWGSGLSVDDHLYFEPVYQDGTYPGDPVPDQGTLSLNTWQTWNAMTGGWHTGGGPLLTTLASYIVLHPDARIVNTADGGGLRIVAGLSPSDWSNFIGNVDQLLLGISNTSVIYDFDPTGTIAGCRSTSKIV